MLDINGSVAEAGTSNVFLLKDSVLVTPETGYILKGITRRTVIELARNELGLEVQERIVKPEELSDADELFLTGTGAEINAVTEYEGSLVGDGSTGPLTRQIKELYRQVTRGELHEYVRWRTIVSSADC